MADTEHTTLADKTLLVHRKDHEGAVQINATTGIIVTANDERPEWSDGLTVALINERDQFYTSRLGPAYTNEMRRPEVLEYADLSWIGVDEEGHEVEIEADAEHRMQTLADIVGVDRSADATAEHTKGTILAEAEVAYDRERTFEEQAALEQAQQERVGKLTGTA